MEQSRALPKVWYLRWVMLALMVALAIALIAKGAVLIGLLVGALAATRVVLFASWSRRRRAMGERFPGRFDR